MKPYYQDERNDDLARQSQQYTMMYIPSQHRAWFIGQGYREGQDFVVYKKIDASVCAVAAKHELEK